MDYNTNARTPFVEKEGELTFTELSTKSMPLTIGKGYLGLLLKFTNTSIGGTDTYIVNVSGAYSPVGSQIFSFDSGHFGSITLVKDGRTVIEYGPSDNAGAASILCSHYNSSKYAASTVDENGDVTVAYDTDYSDTNTGSILVPLAPMMLLPNESPENICHSTYGSNSFTLNITPSNLGASNTLKIECYSVCVQTDKPSNVKYLYTESQLGLINDTFSGFNTEFKSYIYGYTSSIVGSGDKFLTSLYTQGKYIIQDCFRTVCGLLLRLTGFQSDNFWDGGSFGEFKGLSLPLNIDKTLTGGIKTKQIDDTRFRVSMDPDVVGSSIPNMQVTQYQMRGFNE